MKAFPKMSRADFEAAPLTEESTMRDVDGIVLLPTRTKHESGYNVMHLVLVRNGVPFTLYRVTGRCDVLELSESRVECLPTSRLLCIYPHIGRRFVVSQLLHPTVHVEVQS